MKKLSLLGITLLASVTLAACSSSNEVKQAETQAQSEQTTVPETTVATTNNPEDEKKAVREVFDSIIVGDLMSNGEGGTTKDDVIASYGQPASTSSTAINGMNVEQVTWIGNGNVAGVTVSVQFIDNKATNKTIAGFQFSREAKIGLTEFNNLATGTAYADVVKSFGEPDTYSESIVAGSKSVVAGWLSGVKGGLGANFNTQFTNDSLTSKSQTGLTD